MPETVYIIHGMRSPIGSPFKSLKNFSAGQLAGDVINKTLKAAKVNRTLIDEVILGNTVGAGTGQNLARQAVVLAGLPLSTPAYVVNNVCGAGMQAVFCAMQSIRAKESSVVIAGGSESATQAPLLYPNELEEIPKIKINNRRLRHSQMEDGLFCKLTGRRMGELVEDMAQKHNISRQEQDQYALESHVKACVARQWDKGSNEIIPLKVSSTKAVTQDDRPRKNLSLSNLEILPPAFCRNGTVTAGNSSVPCDGAAALVLAGESALKRHRLQPKARILSSYSYFGKPNDAFISAIEAIRGALKRAKLRSTAVDLYEISEAFAVQMIYLKKKLNIPDEKLNIWGGDIALGHPLGAAGSRVVVTLLHALMDSQKSKGVACISLGGGGSLAIVLEILG